MSKKDKIQELLECHYYDTNGRKRVVPLDTLTEKARSDNLLSFFAKEILPLLNHEDAAEEFENGYCDGGGDLKCDAILKTANQVHIIQAKHLGKDKSANRNHVEEISNLFTRLANEEIIKKGSRKLKSLLNDIDYENDSFFLWFLTNVDLFPDAQSIFSQEITIPKELVEKGLSNTQIEFDYYDRDKILHCLESQTSADARNGVDVEIKSIKGSSIIQFTQSDIRSFIMVCDSEQVVKYARNRQTKSALFDFNIRNYLGSKGKNKKIKETAERAPENFYYFNNGVSAVCESAEVVDNGGKIKAHKFTIINGAQTVKTLTAVKESVVQPKLMLRITAIKNFKQKREFLENIVKFNNTQNEIRISDFRSNDPVQRSIAEYVSTLPRKEGKAFEYVFKRGSNDDLTKNSFKITMENLAKRVFEYDDDKGPFTLTAQGSLILFDSEKGYYEKIFGKPDSQPTKLFLERILGIHFLDIVLKQWVKNKKACIKNSETDESVISEKITPLSRAGIMLWSCKRLFENCKLKEHRFTDTWFLRKILDTPSLSITSPEPEIRLLNELFEYIYEAVLMSYKNSINSGLTATSWAKGVNKAVDDLNEILKQITRVNLFLINVKEAFPTIFKR
jgi:hypothetical protein